MDRKRLDRYDFALESGEKHSRVKRLKEEKLSPFRDMTMKDVFIYAMAIGYERGKKVPLKRRTGVIPGNALRDEDYALVKAIGISQRKDVDILFEKKEKELFKIAEEYANGGIDMLFYQVFGEDPGDPDRKMEQALRDLMAKKRKG